MVIFRESHHKNVWFEMEFRNIIIVSCFLIAFSRANAQSLSPSVISSAGDFFSNASGSLSSTVAEMTMVETFSSTNNKLTQGF